MKYLCQHLACFEIFDALKHVYFLYVIIFSWLPNKE